MMYMGQTGIYTNTFVYPKNENCLICSNTPAIIKMHKTETLKQLIENLKKDPKFKFSNPGLSSKENLYIPGIPSLEEAFKPSLDKTLQELISENKLNSNGQIYVSDKAIVKIARIIIEFID